jgi:hypothetical protein
MVRGREPLSTAGLTERIRAMTATVRISRKPWGSSHSTRDRIWKVVIDGKIAGSIANEQSVELPVEPGRHTLRVESMRYLLSPEQSFEANEGQVVGFSCHPRSLSPLILTRWIVWLLATLVKHELWISLELDGAQNAADIRR